MRTQSRFRRLVILGSCVAFLSCGLWGGLSLTRAVEPSDDFAAQVAQIERAKGGRLGIAVFDTKSKQVTGYRMNERFPMCSTFKVLVVGALLAQVDAGREDLSRSIKFTATDLVPYSPATKDRVGEKGMTLSELCEAAITRSDNTAANLLLKCVGGPAGVTSYARSLGDKSTRIDRIEPEMNDVPAGDPRDTTTPAAMMESLNTLVFGQALSPGSREKLTAWLKGNKTGDTRLRAGLPKDWQVGDKTGSNQNSANDIAVIWPSNHPPLIVTVYLTETTSSPEQRNETVAAIGRVLPGLTNR
jgi:beta-lactamase class A